MKTILVITVIESSLAALVLLLWHFKTAYENMLAGLSLTPAYSTENHNASVPVIKNSHWDFINSWQVKPQADDRVLARSIDAPYGDSLSGRRSTRRRGQQLMYKEWSKSRHD